MKITSIYTYTTLIFLNFFLLANFHCHSCEVEFTSDDKAVFFVEQFNEFTITANRPSVFFCNQELPEGISLVNHLDGTATLSGTPQCLDWFVEKLRYYLIFTAISSDDPKVSNSDLFECYICSQNDEMCPICKNTCQGEQKFFLQVLNTPACQVPPDSTPSSPVDVKGYQTASKDQGQKHPSCSDFKNIITWKTPSNSGNIIGYNIFTDKTLKHLLVSIPNNLNLKKFKVSIPFADPCRSKKIYIVSIDNMSRRSKPVKVKIKEKKTACKDCRKSSS